MALDGSHAERVARLLASPGVKKANAPRDIPSWSLGHAEPPDFPAFYAACDGVELTDGVRIFGRGELGDVTAWLVLEKGLSWPDDLVVIGERRDVVVVLDLDLASARAGGGVLEVSNDDLGAFERVASGLVGYLLSRSQSGEDPDPPPEISVRRAAEARDREALERALLRPMYPRSERLLAALSFELGALHAEAADETRALSAFAKSVDARVATVGRAGRDAERVAAWNAAAHVCRLRGAAALAAECESRANAG